MSQALQAGIGSGIVEIETTAAEADNTGRLPDKKSTHKQLEEMTNGDWVGLLNPVVAVLCYADNKEKTFEDKREELLQTNLSEYKKSSEALAHMLALNQAATNAYGSKFMTMCDLMQLVRLKLSREIRYGMDENTANDKSNDLRSVSWRGIEDIRSGAWGTVSR